MGNFKIFYDDVASLYSALTADTEASTFGIERVVHANPRLVYRSTSGGETYLVWDYGVGVSKSLKGVVIVNHSQPNTFFKFQSSNNNFTNLVADEVIPIVNKISFVEKVCNERYYRLKMEDSVASYHQAGVVYLFSSSYEFDTNISWGGIDHNETQFFKKVFRNGFEIKKKRFSRRLLNYPLINISKTQKEKLEEIAANPYVCVLPTGSSGKIYYGTISIIKSKDKIGNYYISGVSFQELPWVA